jgi:eukaryotic-like serine/threonine-protein kinase
MSRDSRSELEEGSSASFLRELARAPERPPSEAASLDVGSVLAGRFELRGAIGRGGFGSVFEAYDRERAAVVALKVLRRSGGRSLYLFKQEFRALAELHHENLVSLYELHADGDVWFFTMELVPGTSGLQGVRGEAVSSFFRQLAAAIHYLHEAGKLHRDIKPSNVIARADGRVTLLDFGLVADIGEHHVAGLAGTRGYIAPELETGAAAGPEADWYAFGVMLADALDDAASPRLRALAERLVDPEPSRRPSGREVLEHLSAAPAQGVERGRPHLVGREEERRALDEALARARGGVTTVVLVAGASGLGKSALVADALERWRDERVTALSGRCFAEESVPYQALDPIVDALYCRLDALPREDLRARLPPDAATLARLFPVLRQLPGLTMSESDDDEVALRRRAFEAMRELLRRMGELGTLVLAIDDLQWGDLDSMTLLAEVLSAPAPLLCILAYRSDDDAAARLLAPLVSAALAVERIDLAPLAPEEAIELACALAPSERAEALAAESHGHPLFLAELARQHDGGPREPTLGALLEGRVERLPPPARAFLEVLALAGRPLGRQLCARAAASAHPEVHEPRAVSLLNAQRLLRVQRDGARETLLPYHDRIREAALARLAPATRREHHRALAVTLEEEGQGEPEELLHHYRHAGCAPEASRHAVTAAERARAALAFDHAARLYQIALDLGAAPAHELAARRADALAAAGRPRDAASAYLALSCRDDRATELEHRRRAMEQLLLAGYTAEGLEVLETLMKAVALRIPSTPLGTLASLAWLRATVLVRGLEVARAHHASSGELARIDTCWTAALGLGLVHPIGSAHLHARHLLLALRAGEPRRAARALLMEASLASVGGAHDRAARAMMHAAPLVDRCGGDLEVLGLSHLTRGIDAMVRGEWRRALGSLRGSAAAFERCAARLQLDHVRGLVMTILWMLGELGELAGDVATLLRDARDRGNRHCEMLVRLSSGALLELAADRPESALAGAREAISLTTDVDFTTHHVRALGIEMRAALYAGRRGVAWRVHGAHRRQLERSRLLHAQIVRIESCFWRAFAALDAFDAGDRDRLRAAARDAEILSGEGVAWAIALADQIGAGVAYRRGERGRALALLERAEDALRACDMLLVATASRRRRGEWLGGDAGRALVAEADTWMTAATIRAPARMTRMLAGPSPVTDL